VYKRKNNRIGEREVAVENMKKNKIGKREVTEENRKRIE